MFNKIPSVLSSEELLDISFKKTHKIQIADRNYIYRKKKTIIAKIDSFSNYIINTLEGYVKKFPSINNLNSFYQEIIDIKFDINKLKKSLGAVDWAKKTCQIIYSKQSKSLKKSKNIDFLNNKQQEIYGRISSVVKQIKKELDYLSEVQKEIKKLPEILELPTIVIAGYPNVGKSSVLRCLSSAKPIIAVYPFTTKEIHVGHIEKKVRHINKIYQIIDTPGLLDRSFSKRNDIEKQALAALSNFADVILFIMDFSETCGYSIEDQKNLLKQLKQMFKNSIFIIVENKSDLFNSSSNNIKISCKNKEGINLLKKEIFKKIESIEK